VKGMDRKNLVILICDGLRYDCAHLLDLDHEYDTRIIKSWTPTIGTLDGWATIFSGLEPEEHNVKGEGDRLEGETIFSLFENSELYCPISFWDPALKSIEGTPRYIFGFDPHEDPVDLPDMEEPFVWVEPVWESHILRRHKERVDKGIDVWVEAPNVEDYWERYLVSLGRLREHIEQRLRQVDLKWTQVIVTADHGDLKEGELDDLSEDEYPDVHDVDHPKVHEIPIIPVPDWSALPDQMDQREILEYTKEEFL